jgi:cell division septation protein DedD
MLRILTPDTAHETVPATASGTSGEDEFAGEFEIVLGRRQVASLSFVVVVVLAVASGASYLAGKAAGTKVDAAKADAAKADAAKADAGKPAPVKAPSAATAAAAPAEAKRPGILAAGTTTIAPSTPKADTPAAPASPPDDASKGSPGVNALLAADASTPLDDSVFGEPTPGSLYVQVGAMDRGPAMILTSGLRKRGFPSVTARGPSATIFRVLVGPYKTLPEYQTAKEAIGQMGITSFGRYGQ